MAAILDGVRVLDLSRFIAGPHCTMMLADMGADVIKVESQKGDSSRHFAPQIGGDGLYLMVFNRNKRSITLNFRSETGQKLLRRLVAKSDVLVENFRPGVMEAMGCSYETLKEINPRLIMVSISGFGQTGPWAHLPSFDAIAQAWSGLMNMTGWPDGPPTLAGTFVVDYMAAVYAAYGTMLALYHRERTGEGQHVDLALLDTAVASLVTAIPQYLLFGEELERNGNRDRYDSPINAFKTVDGYVLIAVANNGQFARFAETVGQPHLLSDPRYATPSDRVSHADELESIAQEFVGNKTTDEVLRIMDNANIPCAKVSTIADVVANPQLKARDMIAHVEHPRAGTVPLPGIPLKMSAAPGEIRMPPPVLGGNNEEVYGEILGLSTAELKSLKESGVI